MDDDDLIQKLKQEIEELKAQVTHLNGMCEAEAADTTRHIKYIYRYLKMLDDRGLSNFKLLVESVVSLRDAVDPIEQELFPEVAKARDRLDAILDKIKDETSKSADPK